MSQFSRPHVVIVGAGFGGLSAARALANAPVDVTVIDKRNHHLFQPLLYQVATAALSPADIAGPIRAILGDQRNAKVLLDRVIGIDREKQSLALASGRVVSYDWLIVATGARHSYFGKDHWGAHAPAIKTIDDATAVRCKILLALERAETETDPERRKALLTFVVIGAGPTGVEMAGAIAELAHRSVSNDFRSITPHCSRVVLIGSEPRVLAAFPEDLSTAAQRSIEQLGVELRLGQRVTHVAQDHVMIGEEAIPTHTAIWAAGVMASPAAEWLDAPRDRAGRAIVRGDLTVPGSERVFVIGDTAAFTGPGDRPLPGIAPVAKQQGFYAAQTIMARLAGREPAAFVYRHYGNLATIGRKRAVIDLGRVHLSGWLAWMLWSVVHVFFLVGYRNRLAVGWNLLWNYLTFARHARLINGDVEFTAADVKRLAA
ncbi:NAD(P)/FAD-dependent oxidoreductase [Novosphingobium sp. Gsoil 351]|uniref:NAD(P)/FAD-dependent oxidoreductase n=1 Tax=Novosphingobium sp. Gsoil 351 TaxID=2675225 RepID=UPI001E2F0C68|nr:NAD(P)/FAD-dependent oxidoreductase [Novosphingobium sp. Gsoil 351]